MELKDLVTIKLRDVKLNETQGTYDFYKSHLGHFTRWCTSNSYLTVNEFDEDALIDYINYQKETASAATINKRVGILKRTFQLSRIDFPFLYGLKKFKETYKTFTIIEFDIYKKIREYVFSYSIINDNHLMHQALLALLVDSGARINELLSIKKSNINLKNYEILLTKTKMNIDRTIYFTESTKKVLARLIDIDNGTPYLLYNFDKKRVATYEDARYLMKKLQKKFNLQKLHTHMFRHTIATLMVEKGADIFSIMEILGHTNVETTQRYTHVSKGHVKKSYNSTMQKLE